MKILIDLSETTLKKLRIKAAAKDLARKTYIEYVLIKDSQQ